MGSSFLALLFYFREGLEIGRLGAVIRDHIARPVAREFRIGGRDVFPSETNQGIPCIDPITALYDVLFNWIVFLILPGVVTIKFIWPVLSNLHCKLAEHWLESFLSFSAVVGCFFLLSVHSWPVCKREAFSRLWKIFRRNVFCWWEKKE